MKRAIVLLGLLLFAILAFSAGAQNSFLNNQGTQIQGEVGIAAPDQDYPLAILDNIISIPVAAFTWDGAVYGGGFFKEFSGGHLTGTGEGFACLCAPIIFPKEASRIKKVVVAAKHTAESGEGYFRLHRVDLVKGSAIELGEVIPSQSSNVKQYEIVPSPNWIGPRFAYYLATCVYEGFFVYGARVYYTVASQ